MRTSLSSSTVLLNIVLTKIALTNSHQYSSSSSFSSSPLPSSSASASVSQALGRRDAKLATLGGKLRALEAAVESEHEADALLQQQAMMLRKAMGEQLAGAAEQQGLLEAAALAAEEARTALAAEQAEKAELQVPAARLLALDDASTPALQRSHKAVRRYMCSRRVRSY